MACFNLVDWRRVADERLQGHNEPVQRIALLDCICQHGSIVVHHENNSSLADSDDLSPAINSSVRR
jgi:hypothetical protein